MSKEMREQINRVKNWKQFNDNLNISDVSNSEIMKEDFNPMDGIDNFCLKEGLLDDMISKLDDKISKSKKSNKESLLRSILNRSNLMLNKYDKIEWDGDILKIGQAYFDYG